MLYGFLNEISVDSAWFMEFGGGSGTTGNDLMASRFNGSSPHWHSSSFIGIRELCNNKFIVLLSNNVYNSLLLHTQPLYDSFTPVKWLEQGLGLLQGPYKLRRRRLLPGISVVVVGPHSRVSSEQCLGFQSISATIFLVLKFPPWPPPSFTTSDWHSRQACRRSNSSSSHRHDGHKTLIGV